MVVALIGAGGVVFADGPGRTGSAEGRVAAILGPAFSKMPPWQQRLVVARYEKYRALPEERRARLKGPALVRFLTRPQRSFDEKGLPRVLRAELQRLPRELQGAAARMAVLRLRQLRLDRALARVPAEERWTVFRALFPQPFDAERARAAHKDLRARVVRDMVAEVKRRAAEQGRELPAERRKKLKRDLARKLIEREERRIVDRVRREIGKLHRHPERARHDVMIERLEFLTPRQRELVRYARRPHECPLLDLAFLGPRPADPREARVWNHDFRLFARLELLSEAGLPRELVLHLAPSGSAEELARSLRAVLRPRPAVR